MKDLFDLPHIENDQFYLFMDNVLGSMSMLTIMTKGGKPLVGDRGPSTATYGYVDNPFNNYASEGAKFTYDSGLPSFLKGEFNQSDIMEQYYIFRDQLLAKFLKD